MTSDGIRHFCVLDGTANVVAVFFSFWTSNPTEEERRLRQQGCWEAPQPREEEEKGLETAMTVKATLVQNKATSADLTPVAEKLCREVFAAVNYQLWSNYF